MLPALLENLALGLDKAGIRYMLVGGQAVLFHGEPRLTRDVDVTLDAGPDRLNDVLNLAKEMKWTVLASSPDEFVRRTMVLPCLDEVTAIRIDLIFSSSPYERQAIQRAASVRIGKTDVRFASAEDLVIHKVVAGRPRDLEDVRGIRLKNPKLDLAYIRRWLREFDLSLGGKFLERFETLPQ